MEFLMLGPFAVRHGERSVDLGDLQQRYVLTVLLLHANRPVSTERLTEIVWGANRPRTNLVAGYIAKLRKAFAAVGGDSKKIMTTPTGYVLRVDDVEVDANRFIELCASADAARTRGESGEARALLHAAVALWRGRFLEDLDPDRIGGAGVVAPDETWLDAIGDLADLELKAGNHRWVRDKLSPIVRDEPGRHELAALLIRALLANGDRLKAMEVYHRSKDALEEYGMEPTREMRGLAWLAQYGVPRSTLPRGPAKFTGRRTELDNVEAFARAAASEDRTGVVWLSGMPGVGKTALAVTAAHLLAGQFGYARLFVALDGYTPNVVPVSPIDALGTLLTGLGVPAERIPDTVDDRYTLYQDWLAGTRTLVVLDNAASSEQVRLLLPEATGCLTIVTSRHVGDLDVADNVVVPPLPPADAIVLFGALVGEQRTRGGAGHVKHIVRRCGGLPLNIRMIASQFRRHHSWPLEHLVTLLGAAGPWDSDVGFDDDGVVACTLSYDHLGTQQQHLFRLFGGLPSRDIGVAAAAALIGSDTAVARSLLEDLYGDSLLDETKPGRYAMPDPLKNFSATCLQPATLTETDDAMLRLLDYYLSGLAAAVAVAYPFDMKQQPLVERRSPVAPRFPGADDAMRWLAAERTNLVDAVRYAAEHDHPDHTWKLAVLLWRYFYTTGLLTDWVQTLELARPLVLADAVNPRGQAHVLLRLAGAYWRCGDAARSLALAESALPLWQRVQDVRGEADTLCAIGSAAMSLGHYDDAVGRFCTALAGYEQIGDTRGQANALSMLGHLNEERGELSLAVEQQSSAVALLRSIGHRQGLAHALDNLGSALRRLGRHAEALAHHHEALTLAATIGDRGVEAYANNYLGNVLRELGELDEALHHHTRAWEIADQVGDLSLRTQIELDRGATHLARREHAQALRAYSTARDLAKSAGDRGQYAAANQGLGQTRHELAEHDAAAGHWRAARTEFHRLGLPAADGIDQKLGSFDCACAQALD